MSFWFILTAILEHIFLSYVFTLDGSVFNSLPKKFDESILYEKSSVNPYILYTSGQ